MIGDALREVAILWVALYPLEAKINEKFNWWYLCGVFATAILLMAGGMFLERKHIRVTISEETSE